MTTASIFADLWQHQLVDHGRQGIFLVLIGFLGSFAFIRMSTRLMRSPRVPWWPGSVVSDSGVHLHHLVFGIVTMLAAGAVGFSLLGESPGFEVCAALFGIGAGLTVDEFALWVHLEDVYWAEEGRSSIDAAVIAVAGMGLVLLGARPFEVGGDSFGAALGSVALALAVVLVVFVSFTKGRVLHGTVGFFAWPVAAYGAVRIGKPGSAWAKRRYGERRPDKQAKAEDRFRPDRRTERFKERFRDVVGGRPWSVGNE